MVSKIGQCGFKETFIWYGNVGKVCFGAGKVYGVYNCIGCVCLGNW